MSRAGKKFVVWAVSFMDNVYGTARMKVPYRPKADYADGLDCKSADDVFKLYWRYTEPQKMGYMSFSGRKTSTGQSQEQKVLNELSLRGVTHMVLETGAQIPDWFKPVMQQFKYMGGEVVRVKPMRSVPPGLDPDEYPYFVKMAWQLMYAYLKSLDWPKAQMGLQVFSAVGTGKDRSHKVVQQQREKSEPGSARRLTVVEVEQLEGGAKISDLGLQLEKLNRKERKLAVEAQEEGLLRGFEAEDLASGRLTQAQVDRKRADRKYNGGDG